MASGEAGEENKDQRSRSGSGSGIEKGKGKALEMVAGLLGDGTTSPLDGAPPSTFSNLMDHGELFSINKCSCMDRQQTYRAYSPSSAWIVPHDRFSLPA